MSSSGESSWKIIDEPQLETNSLPGILHRTVLDGNLDGLEMELWKQEFEPDSSTPMHYHENVEIVLVLDGGGKLMDTDGNEEEFDKDSTLFIPAEVGHRLCSGETGMEIYAILPDPGAFDMKGNPIELPW